MSLLYELKQKVAHTATQDSPMINEDTYLKFEKYLKRKTDTDDGNNLIHTQTPIVKDVPPYLRCVISDELFKDPVVIQSGFTYERACIVEHFKRLGAFDPTTREQVNTNIIIPNHTLKQACEDFLSKNPWAYDHMIGETYESIHMWLSQNYKTIILLSIIPNH